MPHFSIDPDIRKATTLPSRFYTDPAFFELSKDAIFAKTWQFLGHQDELESLTPVTLLPEFLDEPLLLVKPKQTISCLSNVCTHRGKLLVEQACHADLIRCGYHGRRFSLDGKFLSMPEFDGVENFPKEADDLKKIPFDRCRGFMFASLAPSREFGEVIDDVAATFDEFNYGELELTDKRSYEVAAHWALYCENYLEGFHIPYVHQALNAVVDYGSYTTETFRYASVQTAMSEPPALAGGQQRSDGKTPSNIAARYLFLFPNTMFNFYPWGVSVNVVRPISPSKTVVDFLTYVADETLMDKGAGADLHSVELEDEAVVESVQRGIRSRFYDRGRYSATREQGTHHFHRLIAEFMEGEHPARPSSHFPA